MNAAVKDIINRASQWPEEDQEELAQFALQLEARRGGKHHASAAELEAIDQALASVAPGEMASEAEVEAALGRYRRA